MALFTKTVIRCKVNVTEITPFLSVFNGGIPAHWNSTDVRWELAFFKGLGDDEELLDASDITSLTFQVKPLANRGGAAYMEKTIGASAINTLLTQEEWDSGEGQHCIIEFSHSETALPISNGATQAQFWVVISGVTSIVPPPKDVFGTSILTVIDAGVSDPGGPLQGGNIVPSGAVYDGAGHYVLNVSADRVYQWTKGANDTDLVNGTETVNVSGYNLTAQGATVQLRGTAGQAVTAVVRGGVFLTADESDARYARKSEDIRVTAPENGVSYKLALSIVDGQPVEQWIPNASGPGGATTVLADDGHTYRIDLHIVDGEPVASYVQVA